MASGGTDDLSKEMRKPKVNEDEVSFDYLFLTSLVSSLIAYNYVIAFHN